MPAPDRNTLVEIMSRHGERPETGLDQRVRFPLRHCFGKMRLFGAAPHDDVEVQLVDISFSGVGFTTAQALKPGRRVVIDFGIAGIPNQTWDCRVVQCYRLPEGIHHIGAVFETAHAARARKAHAQT